MANENKSAKKVNGRMFEVGNKAAEKWTEDKAIELAEELIEWISFNDKEEPESRVFVNGFFLLEKKIAMSTVTLLVNKFSSFRFLYQEAKKISEYKLAMYGLGERTSTQITKFALINNHGWADKKEVAQTIKELPTIKFITE